MAETEEKPKGHYFHVLKNEPSREELMKWWKSLDENRDERAELRRAETPEEILPAKAFHRLCRILPWWEKRDLLALATVAGVLAHVKEAGHGSFPRQLGSPKEGGDKPMFSELRFQQLLASHDHNEFFQRLRRAVQVAGGGDIAQLADGILHWAEDRKYSTSENPSQRFRYAWAKAYFEPTLNLKQGA